MAESHISPDDLNPENLLPREKKKREIKKARIGDASGAVHDEFARLLATNKTPMELDEIVLPFGTSLQVDNGAGGTEAYDTAGKYAILKKEPGGGYKLEAHAPHDPAVDAETKDVSQVEGDRIVTLQKTAGLIPDQVPWHADSDGAREITPYERYHKTRNPAASAMAAENDTYEQYLAKIGGKNRHISFNIADGSMTVDGVQQRAAVSKHDLRELLAEHQQAAAMGQRIEKAHEEKKLHFVRPDLYARIQPHLPPGQDLTGPVHYDTETGAVFDGRRQVAFLNTAAGEDGDQMRVLLTENPANPGEDMDVRAIGLQYKHQPVRSRLRLAAGLPKAAYKKMGTKGWVESFEQHERATTPGPLDNNQTLTTSEKDPDRTGVVVPDQEYGGNWAWPRAVRAYRKGRQHRMLSGPDAAVRYTGSAGISYGATHFLKEGLGNTLASSVAGETLAMYGAGPAALGVVASGRTAHDQYRYRKYVKPEFDRICVRGFTEEEQDNVEATMNNLREQLRVYGRDDSQKLLDTEAEQHLIEALHARGIADPATAPYLRTERQYAEYAYTRFSLICEAAHRRQQQGKPPHEGLNRAQHDTLVAHYLPAITDPAAHETARNQLLQMSVVYGRLIKRYHKQRRKMQTGGAILGSGAVMSAATLNPIPAIAGVCTFAGKYIWDEIEANNLHLEIGPDGNLRGRNKLPILSPNCRVDAGENGGPTLYDPEEYNHHSALTRDSIKGDDAGDWIQKMKLPRGIMKLRFASDEELLKTAAAHILNQIKNIEPPKKKPEEAEVEHAKRLYDMAIEDLKSVQDERRKLPQDRANLVRERAQLQAELGSATGRRQAQINSRIDVIDKIDLPGISDRLDQINGTPEVAAVPAGPGTPAVPAKPKVVGLLEEMLETVKVRGEEYAEAKKDKPGDRKSPEELVEDDEVRKAFYVLMHEKMKKRKDDREQTWKTTSDFIKGSMKAIKESGPGKVVVSTGASSLIMGGTTAITLTLGGLPFAVPAGLLVGTLAGAFTLNSMVKKMLS